MRFENLIMILVVFWMLASLLCGWIMYGKGRSLVLGFFISLILSPVIGLIITALVKNNTEELDRRRQLKKDRFDDVYDRYLRKVQKHGEVSPELRKLLEALYYISVDDPINFNVFKTALRSLFVFLSSPQGKTGANCRITDYFVCNQYRDSELPKEFKEIINAVETLHGAIEQPEYHHQPEEILEMIRKLPDYKKN